MLLVCLVAIAVVPEVYTVFDIDTDSIENALSDKQESEKEDKKEEQKNIKLQIFDSSEYLMPACSFCASDHTLSKVDRHVITPPPDRA